MTENLRRSRRDTVGHHEVDTTLRGLHNDGENGQQCVSVIALCCDLEAVARLPYRQR